jgi:hypothetical protein
LPGFFIVTVGGVVSRGATAHVYVAGGDESPPESVLTTLNVCEPLERPE